MEVLIPGMLRFQKYAINPYFVDDIHLQVLPFLRYQLTYQHGWPARATQAHKMARFGDPEICYSYRGNKKEVHPWTDLLEYYRDFVAEKLGWRPNCVVVNTYGPTGDLFPHRDSQYIPELGESPTIVSISFGETRDFLIWELDEKGKRRMPYKRLPLEAGDMLVMEGKFDLLHHHGLRPEPNRQHLRLSLTFRKHLT